MLYIFLMTLSAVLVLVGVGAFLISAYHFGGMVKNIKKDYDMLATIFNIFILFLPLIYTDVGNNHRRKFLFYFPTSLIVIAAAIVNGEILDTVRQ